MKPILTPGIAGPAITSIARMPERIGNHAADWRGIAQSGHGLQVTQAGVRAARDLRDLRHRRVTQLANLFPFCVYNLPSVLRQTPDPDNDWRKFRCHGGAVFQLGAPGTGDPMDYNAGSGTDASDEDSHPEAIGSFGSIDDVWVAGGVTTFYFWLEYGFDALGASIARVLYGTDPTAASYADSASTPSNAWNHSSAPWTLIPSWDGGSFPAPDGNHALIAWISLNHTTKVATIRQFLRTDLYVTGGGTGVGMHWKSAFDAGATYVEGDCVYTESTSLGVTTRRSWVCEYHLNGADHAPQWPEESSPTTGLVYWRLLDGYPELAPYDFHFKDTDTCDEYHMTILATTPELV